MREKNIDLTGKTILITGGAGFIGAALTRRLLLAGEGLHIVAVDDLNDYYDPQLKLWRLEKIRETAEARAKTGNRFTFIKGSIADAHTVQEVFSQNHPQVVVNLAAQAGVRYSIDHPECYIASNIMGFFNILEACRHSYDHGESGVEHLIYASSSSVYGGNKKLPYSTGDMTDAPVSLYAATKKSDELLAHAYAHLYGIPSTGLRFFTVYGPAGRPDMAYFKFADMLCRGETIKLFNYGNCMRDFTYIDDITAGIQRVICCAPGPADGRAAPHVVYNIGNSQPVNLLAFVETLRQELVNAQLLPGDFDLSAHMDLVPMQPGDVLATYADVGPLEKDFGFRPSTDLREGLRRFVQWYRDFHGPAETGAHSNPGLFSADDTPSGKNR